VSSNLTASARLLRPPYSGDNATGNAGTAKALTLTIIGAVSINKVTYNYDAIMGHDGHPDPDPDALWIHLVRASSC
jgi:hypothetical protein